MSHSHDDRSHCKRCGSTFTPGTAICPRCSEPTPEGPNLHEKEPGIITPPGMVENPYKAPKGLDEPPSSILWLLVRIFLNSLKRSITAKSLTSTLWLLVRIFLNLLGIVAVVISSSISFVQTCLVVGGDPFDPRMGSGTYVNWPMGVFTGVIAAGVVGFITIRALKWFSRKISTKRIHR